MEIARRYLRLLTEDSPRRKPYMAADHVERDSLGEVRVSDDVYYGVQTVRAVDNFPVSLRGIPVEIVHALGMLKAAAARTSVELNLLPAALGEAIARAAQEGAEGRFDSQFVVDVFP